MNELRIHDGIFVGWMTWDERKEKKRKEKKEKCVGLKKNFVCYTEYTVNGNENGIKHELDILSNPE